MSAFVDFVINIGDTSKGIGPVGQRLEEIRFEPGLLRPYIDQKGIQCVTINTGKILYDEKTNKYYPERRRVPVKALREQNIDVPVLNAGALRPAQWTQIDTAAVVAARQRLTGWSELMRNNPVRGFSGMGKLTYEYSATSDAGEAVIDMTGLAPGRNDKAQTKIRSIPLPIIHCDFTIPARLLAASRNGGVPLDTSLPAFAGRRCAEALEQLFTGGIAGITFGTRVAGFDAHDGTSTIYGLTSYPYRITKSNLTVPTGLNPEATLGDVIAMRELAKTAGYRGPYTLYYSGGWDKWLDNDYFRAGTAMALTLRQRIEALKDINAVERLDYLGVPASGYRLVLVQNTDDVIQGIEGMGVTTLVWENKGGMEVNFKTMLIAAPLLKADYNNNTGVVDATTP